MTDCSRRRFLRDAVVAASAACASSRILAEAPAGKDMPGAEAIEDALALLAQTGPEYAGGLANHGPMAAEALVALGRPESVVPWVEGYRRRLRPHPDETRPIEPGEWREALGDDGRVGDWIAFFDRALREQAWTAILETWMPRLAPGVIAAAFHGVIRTAHAARSLDARETKARTRELAEGLGYWAATYRTLPESPDRRTGRLLPSRAIGEVATLPQEQRVGAGHITKRLGPLADFPSFAGVADLVDTSAGATRFLSDLTETFAGVYRASVPPGGVITYVHAVTGPSAIRLLLPHLAPDSGRALLRYAWQGAAALYAAHGGRPPAPAGAGAATDRHELVDRAVATGDEHAIKFTEACLREHALNPKPVYLSAARDAVERLA
jgi:hypothetical protein